MSRVLTAAGVSSAFAQTTSSAWVTLLRVYRTTAPAWEQCYISDYTATTYGGDSYTPWPFRVAIPESANGRPPEVRLQIDNVDRTLIQLLRAQTAPINADIGIAIASAGAPITSLEAGPYTFSIRDITYDATLIEMGLSFEQILDEPFPAHDMTPHYFPALFGQVIAAGASRDATTGHGGPAYHYGRTKKDA